MKRIQNKFLRLFPSVHVIHWQSLRIDHTEAKNGAAINMVTNHIMTSTYTKNKQKTTYNF